MPPLLATQAMSARALYPIPRLVVSFLMPYFILFHVLSSPIPCLVVSSSFAVAQPILSQISSRPGRVAADLREGQNQVQVGTQKPLPFDPKSRGGVAHTGGYTPPKYQVLEGLLHFFQAIGHSFKLALARNLVLDFMNLLCTIVIYSELHGVNHFYTFHRHCVGIVQSETSCHRFVDILLEQCRDICVFHVLKCCRCVLANGSCAEVYVAVVRRNTRVAFSIAATFDVFCTLFAFTHSTIDW